MKRKSWLRHIPAGKYMFKVIIKNTRLMLCILNWMRSKLTMKTPEWCESTLLIYCFYVWLGTCICLLGSSYGQSQQHRPLFSFKLMALINYFTVTLCNDFATIFTACFQAFSISFCNGWGRFIWSKKRGNCSDFSTFCWCRKLGSSLVFSELG